MSCAAYDRLCQQLAALQGIEQVARALLDSFRSIQVDQRISARNVNAFHALVRALHAYDGWDDSEELVEAAVESMRSIVNELEERDKNVRTQDQSDNAIQLH
jgi:aspartate ammonia-lyase